MNSILSIIERIHPIARLAAVTAAAIVIAAGCARITGFAESKRPPELDHGKNYLIAGDRTNAMAKFDAALASDPKEPRAYCAVMDISARQNDREMVEHYYAKALDATRSLPRPQQAKVHLSAGVAYLILRVFDPAIQACRKAVEMDPDSYLALNGLGYAYAEAGTNLAEAVELINQAIDLARKDNA